MRTLLFALVVAASLGLPPASARAESEPQPFVTRAAQGTLALVALGERAVTLGTNEEIKAFGRLLIDEHRILKSELDTSAAAAGAELPATASTQILPEGELALEYDAAAFDAEFTTVVRNRLDDLLAAYRVQSESGTNALLKSTATRALPVLLRQLEAADALRNRVADAAQ